MLCYVNRCLFPFSVRNNAFPSRALSAYTTSAPASRGGAAAGDVCVCVGVGWGGSRCFLNRLEASGAGSMTAELGSVQRARCRRLDHGKHVLCCGEGTRAATSHVGRLPPQLCCWGWKRPPPLPACLWKADSDIYTPEVFHSQTWISQLTRPRVHRFQKFFF